MLIFSFQTLEPSEVHGAVMREDTFSGPTAGETRESLSWENSSLCLPYIGSPMN